MEGMKCQSLGKTTNLKYKIIIQVLLAGWKVQKKKLSKDEELT